MRKIISFTAIVGTVMALGAGCTGAQTARVAPAPAPAQPSVQTNEAQPSAAHDSEDIDQLIHDATQEDDVAAQKEKSAFDAEIKIEEKTAIETPESEGVTFDQ